MSKAESRRKSVLPRTRPKLDILWRDRRHPCHRNFPRSHQKCNALQSALHVPSLWFTPGPSCTESMVHPRSTLRVLQSASRAPSLYFTPRPVWSRGTLSVHKDEGVTGGPRDPSGTHKRKELTRIVHQKQGFSKRLFCGCQRVVHRDEECGRWAILL